MSANTSDPSTPQPVILESFPVGPLQCNCTILGDPLTHEAVVIDPGEEISRIAMRLKELGLTLKQILITHAHIDHIGSALKLKRLTGAPILLNENDLPLLAMMEQQAGWLGIDTPEVENPDASLADGMRVGLSGYPAQVIHTPGHTQGSVCLYFQPLNLLVAGGHVVCGEHRKDGLARRELAADPEFNSQPPAGPPGEHACAAGAWAFDSDWRGKRAKSVSNVGPMLPRPRET